ncbi:uncharacterized protein LOC118190448 [Stegodyphus dumicola]|uniref:uncharacterized protein LOC118190448 n=1 Tax=Stegodyphus dumicola TaxID=202533 RepID=UPI0015B023A3|nr:uncharacterized protein LOC118190448 [Stegodyphus dumicola]
MADTWLATCTPAGVVSEPINRVISAELPDKDEDPILYEISFQTQTSTSDDRYPKYRRRSPEQSGQNGTIRNHDIDSRWIVPYNLLLLKIFYAHINVELCNSIKSIQYVTKYINKGSDQVTFSIQSPNEVEKYQSGRYICSSEAVWRILSFEVHDRAPTIVHLAVHLENGQRVYFTENNIQEVVNNPRDTTLTALLQVMCSR